MSAALIRTAMTRREWIEHCGEHYRARRDATITALVDDAPPLSAKDRKRVDWLYAPKKSKGAQR